MEGIENLPEGPCLLICNHAHSYGPVFAELYIPGKHKTWCASQMMKLKEVPAYTYEDFWGLKPGYIRWLYKLASYIIAPLSVCIFNNADTIAVYKDTRIISTFRQTVEALEQGYKITIFPEQAQSHNNIVNEFQEGFVDIARMYRNKCGKDLPFVPVYIAPKLKKMYIGKAIYLDYSAPKSSGRRRICDELMASITDMATALPEHTVIPYLNTPKRHYPKNIPSEVEYTHEKTAC